jgi:steroid 5-alpha reductase family enzyme
LLMRVSGVTLLEKTLVNRMPEYAEYIDKTSAFFPMPPR